MSATIYFSDNAARAAIHLLDSDFGNRIREVAKVDNWPEAKKAAKGADLVNLGVTYDPDTIRYQLSRGEKVLFRLLESMTFVSGGEFAICDLANVDDDCWDRVIECLYLLRGRSIEAVAS